MTDSRRIVFGKCFVGLCLAMAALTGCGGSDGASSPASACSAWSGLLQLDASTSYSAVNAVAALGACDFIFAGYENAATPGEPSGNARGFVRRIRIDPGGFVRQQWEYLLDTHGADAILGFERAGERIMFWGTTDSAIDGHLNAGKRDVLLGVLTVEGELLKLSQLGNQKPNVPLKPLNLSSGAMILVGNDDVYVPTNYVESFEDPWFASITEHADSFVANSISNRDSEVGDLHTDGVAYGDSFITALHTGTGPERGIALERRLASGDVVWSLPVSGSPYDVISTLYPDPESGLLLAFGTTYLQLGDERIGDADYFIAAVDPDAGEIRWVRQFGSPQLDWARRMLVSDSGLTVLGEVLEEDGTWSVAVHDIATDGTATGAGNIRLGIDTKVEAACRTGQGLLVAGKYASAPDAAVGYLRLLVSDR